MRVLIVDDDKLTCEMLEELLPDEGLEIRTVSEGADALEQLASWRPDVLLCDLNMPGLSGQDLINTIKSDPRWGRPRIIVFTAAREVPPARTTVPERLQVLYKPIGLEELKVAIAGR